MARASWKPLVELPHGNAVAAVLRDDDDGWLWLSGNSRRAGGTGISDYGVFAEGWGDKWVVGGALPPGATRAQLRGEPGASTDARAANGGWVAVIDRSGFHRETVVRYLDDAGEIVRRPLPPGTDVTPVPDAREPCPACGGRNWSVAFGSLEMLVPDHAMDRSDDYAEHRTVICDRCGHQEAVGAFLGISDDDEEAWPPEPAEERADVDRELAEAERILGNPFADADFQIYGLDAWEGIRALGGAGASNGRFDQVTLDHGSRDEGAWVSVTTESPDEHDFDERPKHHAEEAYGQVSDQFDAPWPRLSEEALTLLFAARSRAWQRTIAETERRMVDIAVDDKTVEFHLIGSERRWAASANYEQLRLTIQAVGVAPSGVRLIPVEDPSSYRANVRRL
ncbi:MAG: TFIIB-type zinc finger domain-containing protein [Thermoleophilaceae bacterium]